MTKAAENLGGFLMPENGILWLETRFMTADF